VPVCGASSASLAVIRNTSTPGVALPLAFDALAKSIHQIDDVARLALAQSFPLSFVLVTILEFEIQHVFAGALA
jgi:hypothetical protein